METIFAERFSQIRYSGGESLLITKVRSALNLSPNWIIRSFTSCAGEVPGERIMETIFAERFSQIRYSGGESLLIDGSIASSFHTTSTRILHNRSVFNAHSTSQLFILQVQATVSVPVPICSFRHDVK